MQKTLIAIMAAVATVGMAWADEPVKSTLADQKEIFVTVYNSNLGLVKDVRKIALQPGISELQFMGVAERINPTTVHIKSLIKPESLSVLEQNYEYDLLNQDDTRSDLTGWVTIDNQSGATYKDATIQLVAGDVHRIMPPPQPRAMGGAMYKARDVAESGFEEKAFFEYHIYTLGRKSTIKEKQTKQISLLEASDVPLKKKLIFYGAEYYYRNQYGQPVSNQKVGVYIDIENKKENNLGLPLPKGVVRVYKADHVGRLQFVGEDAINHTPKDEKMEIKMGEAFDVVGERKQKDWKKIAENVYEVAWEIALRNHKEEAVEVQVIEPIPGDWTLLESSHKSEKIEAHTLKYIVKIPKDKEEKISYRVRVTW